MLQVTWVSVARDNEKKTVHFISTLFILSTYLQQINTKKYFFHAQSVHIIHNQHVANRQLLNKFLHQSRKVHCKS